MNGSGLQNGNEKRQKEEAQVKSVNR